MTLQEVTEAHSQRISSLHKQRDRELRDAAVLRDAELRALPAADRLFQRLDEAVSRAMDDRTQAEYRATAALASTLDRTVDERSEALARTQLERKETSLRLLEQKRAGEAAAESAYRDALSGLDSTTPLAVRQKTAQDADRRRRDALEKAAEAYASAVAKAQADYRAEVDDALAEERLAERRAEQTYESAMRVADASYNSALAASERELLTGLNRIPDAVGVLQSFDARAAQIRSDAADQESRLFERFRDELRSIGHYA
jgi:hypothetical protein